MVAFSVNGSSLNFARSDLYLLGNSSCRRHFINIAKFNEVKWRKKRFHSKRVVPDPTYMRLPLTRYSISIYFCEPETFIYRENKGDSEARVPLLSEIGNDEIGDVPNRVTRRRS